MNQRDLVVIQGMLDARTEFDLRVRDPENKSVVCPFDPLTESQEYDYWWEGYTFHRDPKIVG
jgi:hypothetical protein